MPFIEADLIDQSTTHFAVSLDDGPYSADLPVSGSPRICRYDVSSVSVGPHIIRMKAVIPNSAGWGRLESAPSDPFSFTKPAAPVTPSGIRLVP
jgi:hypothetical protein